MNANGTPETELEWWHFYLNKLNRASDMTELQYRHFRRLLDKVFIENKTLEG